MTARNCTCTAAAAATLLSALASLARRSAFSWWSRRSSALLPFAAGDAESGRGARPPDSASAPLPVEALRSCKMLLPWLCALGGPGHHLICTGEPKPPRRVWRRTEVYHNSVCIRNAAEPLILHALLSQSTATLNGGVNLRLSTAGCQPSGACVHQPTLSCEPIQANLCALKPAALSRCWRRCMTARSKEDHQPLSTEAPCSHLLLLTLLRELLSSFLSSNCSALCILHRCL
jgi:hypothetical protein